MDYINGALGYTLTLNNKQVRQLLLQMDTDFARASQNAIAEMDKVQSKMSSIAVLGGSFLSISAAKGFVTELIHVRGEFQQIENAIETITGSQDKMNSLMTEWKDLTLRSPFRLSEIAQSGKQLLAYGVEVEKVTDDIEMLGNIASGVSAPINDIAYLYGTLKTQGRAYQQDIIQFTGRGIPIIKELAKQFGVAESEIKDLVTAGKIGFPEVEKALRAMTSEGGQFYNLIGKQATTLTGAMNRLKHETELAFNQIGADSEGLLSGGINVVTHLVENYQTLGKTLGVLITTYGAYKAAVMVTNTIEQIRYTTTLALGTAEGRVTTIQGLRYLATLKLTAAQTALNAVMMANPYAIIIAGAVALGTAYYLLSDNTTSAQRAQEAYNKTQEEVKSKLDETKKKADEYINTLKDETATVYQQIQAYNALQALKLKGLENLTQEQIATMDLTELRKLLNASYDEKGLSSQKKALEGISEQVKEAKNNLKIYNETIANGGKISQSTLNEANKRVETLNREYDLQASKVRKVEEELKISNMTLGEQKSYYEGIVQELQNKVNEIRKVNEQQADSKNAADLVASAFAQWDISKLNFQLNDTYSKIYEINDQINKTGPIVKDKSYWENDKKDAEDSLSKLDPTDPRNKKEWQELTTRITKAKDSLKAWDVEATKVSKPKTPKTPKKSDDPVEIFKKQVQGMKDEYDRYVNYMNTDDIVLKATADFKFMSLKKQGNNYEEYLRNVQKQLANVTNKTKAQVKELQYVNDELAKIIDYNAFDKYKEGINEQVDSSENLLKVIGLLEEEKQKFANSTDQIEKDKFKFIDEKEIDVIKKTDDAAKSLIKTLTEEANPLDTINKKFDEEIELLKYKLEKAQTDIEKESITVNIEQVEAKRRKALEDIPTNNSEYNQLLKDYQDYQVKKETLEKQFSERLKTVQKARTELQNSEELKADKDKLDKMLAQNTATENEILKQKKNAVSKINLEQLQSSDSYMKLLTEDMERMSLKTIKKIISDLENAMKDPNIGLQMNAQDIKIVTDQIQKLKDKAIQANPFKSLQEGWDSFLNGASVDDKLKGLDKMNQAFDQINTIVNSTLDIADSLGINVSESTRDAVELGAELFQAGTQIAEGIASNNPVQVIQGITKAVTSIFKSRDKKRQREIKRYQQAVDDLARSFKNLEYATNKALGGDTYKNQNAMLDNLTRQQEEYRKMIQAEQRRKKTDKNKIKEWEQAIIEIDQAKQDLLDSLAQDVLQTNAKDLGKTLGEALAEAWGKGEDAAKSYEKVANDVLKNAVLNQLQKQLLEDQLQKALDELYKDMGADANGNVDFKGLSPEDQKKFKDEIQRISENFTGALEMYSDLFKDLEDPNQNSLSGAIAGVSEETASIISGQMNAVRILIADANKQRDLSNKILLQQLDRLANIDANTRVIEPLLNKLIDKIDKLGENRSYGF